MNKVFLFNNSNFLVLKTCVDQQFLYSSLTNVVRVDKKLSSFASIQRFLRRALNNFLVEKLHATTYGNQCCTSSSLGCRNSLGLKRVVIYEKTTRYEYEKQRLGCKDEVKFKELMDKKGSPYDSLLKFHKKHAEATNKIKACLNAKNIAYRVFKRIELNEADMSKAMEWADAMITAGGDGTFLSAASKIHSRNKPCIGVNTRPETSEGHLCISSHHSINFDHALQLISLNKFKWLFRKRIRVTMEGQPGNFVPIENADVLPQIAKRNNCSTDSSSSTTAVLPTLALNEVFMGESLSSIPSDYEIKIDDGDWEKQKSSGVCISTGTGSTAWSFSICSLHKETVKKVLQSVNEDSKIHFDVTDEDLVDKITDRLKHSYIFDPSENKMLVSIRDPIQNQMFSCRSPHQFATKVSIRSRCWDATLCIDGHTSFTFDDGAIITLEMFEEDDLRVISLPDT